jgi:hypothetical protein
MARLRKQGVATILRGFLAPTNVEERWLNPEGRDGEGLS